MSKMKTLSLRIKKLSLMIKFFKGRSKVTVTCSKLIVPQERSCHEEQTCCKYVSPISKGEKVMANVKVFQK